MKVTQIAEGVPQYQLGKQHALQGMKHMSHRKTQYNGASQQRSYDNGYNDGLKEKKQKKD